MFGELTSTEGRRWLAALPNLVRSLEEEWEVSTGQPYLRGTAAWTAPAVTVDGQPAVLKVCWPHREARHEAEGLRLWDGVGAVRVLRSDTSRWAMLLEPCDPGIAVDECGRTVGDALERAGDVLRRLWSVPVPADAPFERMGDVTRGWAAAVRERMARHQPRFDAGVVELGAGLLETLPDGGRTVVIHGDFNPGNVLSSQREPFLAIDAKPMVGDAAYDPKPLLDQLGDAFAGGDPAGVPPARHVRRVLDRARTPQPLARLPRPPARAVCPNQNRVIADPERQGRHFGQKPAWVRTVTHAATCKSDSSTIHRYAIASVTPRTERG